jgi:hypothetical protein
MEEQALEYLGGTDFSHQCLNLTLTATLLTAIVTGLKVTYM